MCPSPRHARHTACLRTGARLLASSPPLPSLLRSLPKGIRQASHLFVQRVVGSQSPQESAQHHVQKICSLQGRVLGMEHK